MAQVKMGVTQEALKGQAPMPAGWYKFRLTGFKPAYSKDKGSINFQPQMKIVEHKEYTDRHLFNNGNSKAVWILQDLAHCLGLPFEKQPDGSFWFPMHIEDNGAPGDPTKWKITSPAIGRTGEVEIVVTSRGGKDQNDIKQFKCAITNCNQQYPDIRHSSNLVSKK